MFGIGMGHMLLLAAIALVAIGPKQLPEVARMLARFFNDMKKIRDEFTRTLTDVRNEPSDVVPNTHAVEPHTVPHFPLAPPREPEAPIQTAPPPIGPDLTKKEI